ncbi:hypothetical protein LINPERPRIM_LOCUS13284 [Linum perenne]
MSSTREIGTSPSPTPLEKATRLSICLSTMGTPSALVFILIVLILLRLIELFGAIM